MKKHTITLQRIVMVLTVIIIIYAFFNFGRVRFLGITTVGMVIRQDNSSDYADSRRKSMIVGYSIGNRRFVEIEYENNLDEFAIGDCIHVKSDSTTSDFSSFQKMDSKCSLLGDSIIIYNRLRSTDEYQMTAEVFSNKKQRFEFPEGSYYINLDYKQENEIHFSISDKVRKILIVKASSVKPYIVNPIILDMTSSKIDTMIMEFSLELDDWVYEVK